MIPRFLYRWLMYRGNEIPRPPMASREPRQRIPPHTCHYEATEYPDRVQCPVCGGWRFREGK